MKKKRIVIEDAFALENPAGIGYYTRNLYKNLLNRNDVLVYDIPKKSFLYRVSNSYIRKLLYIVWLNTFFLLKIKFQGVEVVHFTNYITPIIRLKKCRYLVTIHDLWDDRGLLSRTYSIYIRTVIKNSLKKSHSVLTVTNTIRSQILKEFDIASNKIITVYEGYETSVVPHKKKLEQHPKGYILFVGTQSKQKNIKTLLSAFLSIQSDYLGDLVLIGKEGDSTGLIDDFVKDNKLSSRIFNMGYCDRNIVFEYMSSASLFVFPSVYEGFGIGLLEAMSYNLTILASEIPTTKEIAGDSIYYFSPIDSAQNLAEEIIRVTSHYTDQDIENRKLQYSNILSKFSWEESVNLHIQEYCRPVL